ncbi:quinone-dependent dihydroorotate dehydrogenase [bacterium]|nr:quinone-dependent dihydroorotate dehydrogenase [bacterium]NBS51021.1 quinone-dependent dihydroorotate dehydrogenase [Spartobacteria bacterium]
MNCYLQILRPLLFCLPAEAAHNLAMAALRLTPSPLIRSMFGPLPQRPLRLFGLDFPNPVGLAAGMDKNAVALPAWQAMGFGFLEAGTITALAQTGNDKPRSFRFPSQEALINRMGFNNRGASAAAKRLRRLKASRRWPSIPVGINIGKSKVTPLENAASDYATSYNLLLPYGDYFVINVSSPNTPGLRTLQDSDSLAQIIRTLKRIHSGKPLLVKIAPDLTDDAVREMAALAESEKLAGIIATNTTLDHSAIPTPSDQTGGLSGAPLRQRSTEVIRTLRSVTQLPIIASGGIMDAASAKEKLDAGANLVQIYTGFVYHGPELIRDIVGAI